MWSNVGVVLRLVGPLIQVLCLILLLQGSGRDRVIAGVPLQYVLYAGLGLGLILVIVGLALSLPRARTRPSEDRWLE